jgi:hypothetical protein
VPQSTQEEYTLLLPSHILLPPLAWLLPLKTEEAVKTITLVAGHAITRKLSMGGSTGLFLVAKDDSLQTASAKIV